MLAMFAKSAGADDGGHHMSGAEMTMAPVKIGGHEFMPDSDGTQAFNAWVKSAKANNEMIQVGPDPTNHVEINTMAGKMEIVKAQLQLKGLSESQAIDAIKTVKTQLQPVKPFVMFKAKAKAGTTDSPSADDTSNMPSGSVIKAGKAIRGPMGRPIAAK